MSDDVLRLAAERVCVARRAMARSSDDQSVVTASVAPEDLFLDLERALLSSRVYISPLGDAIG